MTASSSVAINDRTISGPNGSITDTNGNIWTITAAGVVNENGTAAGYTANVAELADVNGIIWQENAGHLWWSWTGSTWSTGAGTSTNPLPAAPAPAPTMTPSANDTAIIGPNGSIIDAKANTWTITAAGVVDENGAAAGYTANVAELAYVNGTIWQENAGHLWWSWTGSTWSSNAGTSTSPLPTAPAPGTVIGSGSDTIVLTMSEDADGPVGAAGRDATFTVNVDGQQIGGLQIVTAARSAGQTETFTFKGNFAPGQHNVSITFANNSMTAGDKAAFNDGGDRNLYVDGVTYDNTAVSSTVTGIYVSGVLAADQAIYGITDTTVVPANAPSTPTTTPPSVSVGTGADTLSLAVCEDPYAGNAQFTVSVDGKQVGGTLTTSAIEWEGQSQRFNLRGSWGNGPHTVAISFLNDTVGPVNSAGEYDPVDRNLFINSVSYDGTVASTTATGLWNNGSVSFSVPSTKPPIATSPSSAATTDTVRVTAGAATLAATLNGTPLDGDIFSLTDSGIIQATLGSTATSVSLTGSAEIDLTGGSGRAIVAATSGQNVFTAGSGSIDISGGVGADSYVFHAGSGALTIEDFSVGKGDVLIVDSSLKGSMQQGSDGAGGLLLSFAPNATIDLRHTVSAPAIRWI